MRPWSETMVSKGPDHGVGVDPETFIKADRSSVSRDKSISDPNAFKKYRDTPPISTAILLQTHALLFAASVYICTTNLGHDAARTCTASTFAEVLESGVVGTPPNKFRGSKLKRNE